MLAEAEKRNLIRSEADAEQVLVDYLTRRAAHQKWLRERLDFKSQLHIFLQNGCTSIRASKENPAVVTVMIEQRASVDAPPRIEDSFSVSSTLFREEFITLFHKKLSSYIRDLVSQDNSVASKEDIGALIVVDGDSYLYIAAEDKEGCRAAQSLWSCALTLRQQSRMGTKLH